MCLLIETVCYENDELLHSDLHNERLNCSRKNLFGLNDELKIENEIHIPSYLNGETVKCRVIYKTRIEKIEYEKYVIRPVKFLKLVECNNIEYAYKYADRSQLTSLCLLRGKADDILIVKEGYITDTSYANIVFLKDGSWITPINPLLKGIRRESYIRSGRILPVLIRPEDLSQFSEARIINAMISLKQSPIVAIQNISW